MSRRAASVVSTAKDAVRSSLWPIPTLALLAALLLSFVMAYLDRRVDDDLPGWLLRIIFSGDAGAAQTVLDAISSSLITVTSLTFSLTVVTLQLASSQFSPRLLRTFSRDIFVQVTLGLFLATFVYSLTLLRLIRSSDSTNGAFVPRMGTTLAFLLAVASVFMLVMFLAHLTETIRVEAMLRNVHDEATSTLDSVLDPRDEDDSDVERPVVPPSADIVLASASGFITGSDSAALMRCAEHAEAVVSLDLHPGTFVVAGEPLARVWSVAGGSLSDDAFAAAVTGVCAAVTIQFERTAANDVAFGLRQLTDVANKALSPGINDPTTAVHAIGHISSLLCVLSHRVLGARVLRDDQDRARVIVDGPDFAELVEVAIGQPRRYGASDPELAAQLLRLLAQVAGQVPQHRASVVTGQLERLEATIGAQDFDETERAMLARLAERVRGELARPPARRAESSAAD